MLRVGTLNTRSLRNGGTQIIGPGGSVTVDQTATVEHGGLLTVDGGNFAADLLLIEDGAEFAVPADCTSAMEVRLAGTSARLSGGTLTNQGILAGEGRVSAILANDVTGGVRAADGERLIFTGAGNTNGGSVEVLDAEIEFTQGLQNLADSGLVYGSGSTLRFGGGGLDNAGSVALAFGTNDVFGDIANSEAGTIVVSGGGNAAFHDDIVNDGEIRVSNDCTAVFFGDVTGTGSFTGSGTKYFEGDLRPGHSPGFFLLQGKTVLGPYSRLVLEVGGTEEGEYDQLRIDGTLQCAGTLALEFIDGFTAELGDRFTLFEGVMIGEFDDVSVPELAPGLDWSFATVSEDGVVEVVLESLPGDLNADGFVGSQDLDIVRANWGRAVDTGCLLCGDASGDGFVDSADLDIVRADWGNGTVAVPEPSVVAMIVGIGIALAATRRRG